MKQVPLDEQISDFDPQNKVKVLESLLRTGATHVVLFRNLAFDSVEFGATTVVCVGPHCTYKKVEDAEGRWLNDLPSQRQYPQAFAEVTTNGKKA